MSTAYWINTFTAIHDEAKLARFIEFSGPAMRAAGGRFPARHHWALSRGEIDNADVTITTTREALARFLTGLPEHRDTDQPDLTIAGSRPAVRTLLEAIAVFPLGPDRSATERRRPGAHKAPVRGRR